LLQDVKKKILAQFYGSIGQNFLAYLYSRSSFLFCKIFAKKIEAKFDGLMATSTWLLLYAKQLAEL